MIQIKEASRMNPRGGQDRENVGRMVRLAIFHFEFALEKKAHI
jgi:hypothetical protein